MRINRCERRASAVSSRSSGNELRALPVEERIELLLASLDEEQQADPDHAEAWISEIKRRLAEIDSGSVKLMDWDQVRARIDERIRTGR